MNTDQQKPNTANESTILSINPKVTDRMLTTWLKDIEKNKKEIARVIEHRLIRRFINPIEKIQESNQSGFLIMANACLLIETLQSFKFGLDDTRGCSESKFVEFFTDHEDCFGELSGYYRDFYRNIRCGILHQAETKNGFKIRLKGKLFDPKTKIINARAFIDYLETAIYKYIGELNDYSQDETIWEKAKLKLGFIIKNCKKSEVVKD